MNFRFYIDPDTEQPHIYKHNVSPSPKRRQSPGESYMNKIDRNKYPEGWNQERVQRVIEHYENQSEEDAIAEDEAAFEQGYTVMQVPLELAPVVRQLIALMEEKTSAAS